MNKTIQLTIPGSTPSKKNRRTIFIRGGRIVNIPQNKYLSWHKDALKSLKFGSQALQTCKVVTLSFYAKDKRKFDLSNKAESIMDLLVDAGILEDDNYSVVPTLLLNFGGIDKSNPRCEVIIQM